MADANIDPQFWRSKSLDQMTTSEWEALCDGCGKCCMLKLEDEDTCHIHYTNIACRLFDDHSCRCTNYALRRQLVAGCVVLTPENIERNAYWMPKSCAYRLLYEGNPLPEWHPLIMGDKSAMHQNGHSMHSRTIAEFDVAEEDQEDYVIEDM
ncbi:MAG: YcgN family cysteine cluster protein [Pseudomonadota bacterium]